MTAHKLALIKTAKVVGLAFGLGLVFALLFHFVPLDVLMIAGAAILTIFMAKMVYDMNLSQAREELRERNIDNSAR
jgi:hypothetical protein